MKKILTVAILLGLLPLVNNFSYAEMIGVEKDVVHHMNRLKEIARSDTSGIPEKDIKKFLSENTERISDTYKISIPDILHLMLHNDHNVPLPKNYNGPSEPTDKQKTQLTKEIEESISYFSAKSTIPAIN